MQITEVPPPPTAKKFAVECDENELKLLRYLVGKAGADAERAAKVPLGIGYGMYAELKKVVPAE